VSGVAVVVESSPGAVVFGKPYAATPTTPPPPPVDPHAECNQKIAELQVRISTLTTDNATLAAKIAKAQEDLR